MKRTAFILFTLFITALPLSAWADHHEVFIHGLQKVSSNACALELWINAPSQNGFEGVDRITVNGIVLASIGDAEAAAIDSGGHVNVGDSILFGSSSFQSQTGLAPDVTFADANCAGFSGGMDFSFVIDDPTFGGPDKVIDTLHTDSNFGGNNTAMIKSTPGSSPQFVDLNSDSVIVSNNSGTTITLGSTGGGGCSLRKAPSPMPRGNGLIFLVPLALATAAIKIRCRVHAKTPN